MILLENLTDLLVPTEILEKIAKHLTDKNIELILCDDEFIKAINKKYRKKNDPTDVLSFPIQGDRENEPAGSVVISLEQVAKQAETYGHSSEDELALLFIHGVLHLLGHDHEKDNGEMREIEENMIRHFGLPNSLIVRVEERCDDN